MVYLSKKKPGGDYFPTRGGRAFFARLQWGALIHRDLSVLNPDDGVGQIDQRGLMADEKELVDLPDTQESPVTITVLR